MAVTRVQSAAADANDPTATFGSTPTSGNLLVATAMMRSGDSATGLSISGSGWTKQLTQDNELANGSFRCAGAVWYKVAGAAEPTGITITTPGGTAARVVTEEFHGDAGEVWTTLQDSGKEASGAVLVDSFAVGPTASLTGEVFMWFGAMLRQGVAPVASSSWSGAISGTDLESGQNTANTRHIAVGYGTDAAASGTKTGTITDDGSGESWTGGVFGWLIFTTDAGGGDPDPVVVKALSALGVG